MNSQGYQRKELWTDHFNFIFDKLKLIFYYFISFDIEGFRPMLSARTKISSYKRALHSSISHCSDNFATPLFRNQIYNQHQTF